jgi:hypothetical protein
MEAVKLAEVSVDTESARLLGHEYALQFLALPFARNGTHLHVAMCDPQNIKILGHLTDITGHFILPVQADEDD